MSKQNKSKRITVPYIQQLKQNNQKIAMLTAYDTFMAKILDQTLVDIILVGDSGGMVSGGHESTVSVTMEEMLVYTKAVRKGVKRALLIADMPFMSIRTSEAEALKNAARFLHEAGAEAVKIEGGAPSLPLIKKIVSFGIPVMGHLGLTPQSVHQLGGYRLEGKDVESAEALKQNALALQKAGAFSIVLEKIPAKLASEITASLAIPTIGIGAGAGCDGQVLVSHDMLGLFEDFKPKFVRHYAKLAETIKNAFNDYVNDVKNKNFPSQDESY
jgi:3-methyl-2-oxobutanoate hydroxymethyltransferase